MKTQKIIVFFLKTQLIFLGVKGFKGFLLFLLYAVLTSDMI
jgi:hypothetical protein